MTDVVSTGDFSEPSPFGTTGPLTFLFTDVVESTRLWAERPAEMSASLKIHDHVLRSAVDQNGGSVFTSRGDGFGACFATSEDAVQAALSAQQGLLTAEWSGGPEIEVRMGLHRGPSESRDGNYFGPAVNLASRVCDAGNGGQTLLTEAVELPGHTTLSCGRHRLSGVPDPIRILQLGDQRFPPLRAMDTGLSNLPVAANDLIGREDEAAELTQLLAEARLVTLTGPGGVGKTRLSYSVAEAQLPKFADGVWVAELAATKNLTSVLSTVSETLRIPPAATAERLAELVGGQSLLIVLDNCEHVVDDVAELCGELLAHCSRLKILASSRERIGLQNEHIYRVEPLGTSGAAEELFVQRAKEIGVEIDLADMPSVSEICQKLDGIPLAVELAAATTRVLAPGDMTAHMDNSFDLLGGSRRGRGKGRHQTLQAAIDWSYSSLDNTQKILFRRLSAFHGGIPLDGATWMAADLGAPALIILGDLVDRSMLSAETRGRRRRYVPLEVLRQYGRDRLDDEDERQDVVELHAQWCENLIAQTAADAFGAEESRLIGALVDETSNIRVAISRLIDSGQAERAADLALGLEDFAYAASVLAQLVEPVVVSGAADQHLERQRLMSIELIRRSTSDGSDGRASLAAELANGLRDEDPGAMQIPVLLISNALKQATDPSHMIRLAERARSIEDPAERARLLIAALLGTFYADDLPKQTERVTEALEAAEAAGMKRLLIPAASMACLGGLAAGTPREATDMARPILEHLDELPNASIMSSGLITMYTEAAVQAELSVEGQLAALSRLGPTLEGDFDRVGLALARVIERHGDPELAVRAVGACASKTRSEFSTRQRETILTSATSRLGEAKITQLLAQGAGSERSDLYREMWAAVSALTAAPVGS